MTEYQKRVLDESDKLSARIKRLGDLLLLTDTFAKLSTQEQIDLITELKRAMNKHQEKSGPFPRRFQRIVRAAAVQAADSCRWLAVRCGRRGWDDLADWLAGLAFAIDGEQP